MNEYDIVKLKNSDLDGIVMIPSKLYMNQGVEYHSLNNVWFTDDSKRLVGDEDLELNDDRTKKFNKEIEKLYNK